MSKYLIAVNGRQMFVDEDTGEAYEARKAVLSRDEQKALNAELSKRARLAQGAGNGDF